MSAQSALGADALLFGNSCHNEPVNPAKGEEGLSTEYVCGSNDGMFDFYELELKDSSVIEEETDEDGDDGEDLNLDMMYPLELADSDSEDADTPDGHRKRPELAKLREDREKRSEHLPAQEEEEGGRSRHHSRHHEEAGASASPS